MKSQYQDLVCVSPRWLCSSVIGHLLSLDFVAQARVTGCYTVDDFQVAFSECDALDVLQVLEALQMCTQVRVTVNCCYIVDDFQVAFSECDALDVLQVLEPLQMCTSSSSSKY